MTTLVLIAVLFVTIGILVPARPPIWKRETSMPDPSKRPPPPPPAPQR